jgi:hypothetical protein
MEGPVPGTTPGSPTRRELGAAAAGGKIASQPVGDPSWGVLPAWMRSAAAVSPGGCVPANEEFAGAGVEKNEACRVQWQRTLLKEARRESEAEVIGSEDFRPGIADTGRRPGHAVQDAPFPGTDIPAGTSRSSCPGDTAAAWPNRKDACSAWSSCSARARASRTESDTPRRFPLSGRAWYSELTPASIATSSRLGPTTRRTPR